MNIAALLSGGKDSLYAAYVASMYGWNLTHAVTIQPRRLSWMYHTDNIHLTGAIAGALDLPLVVRESRAEKEHELTDLQMALTGLSVDGVVSGAVASEYQRTRIERVCHALHLKSFTPLWHKNGELLLRDMVAAGFDIVIVAVAAEGLDERWLGRHLDSEAINDLVALHGRYGIHVAGEGGEYETLVLDCPLYRHRLTMQESETSWDGSRGTLHVSTIMAAPETETQG
jgi:ABC transporter with metal-binding/Fe-S-binding domain ATP-binding protein